MSNKTNKFKMMIEKNKLKNSLLNKYTSNKKCNSSFNTLGISKINELSRNILQSCLCITNHNIGIHKILFLVVQDLNELLKNTNDYFKNFTKSHKIQSYIFGIDKYSDNIKIFFTELVKVIDNLKNKKCGYIINLKKDLEDPISELIAIYLMGGKSKNIKSITGFRSLNNKVEKFKEASKKLLNELIKYIFIIYLSSYGIVIHEKCLKFNDDPDIKNALLKILDFYISHTVLSKSSIFINSMFSKLIDLTGEEKFNIFVDELNKLNELNKKCSLKYDCLINNSKKDIEINNFKNISIDIERYNLSLLKQSIDGSLIAKIIVTCELHNNFTKSFDFNLFLGEVIDSFTYNYLPEYILGIYSNREEIKEIFFNKTENIIQDYDSLNCVLITLNKYLNSFLKYAKFFIKNKFDISYYFAQNGILLIDYKINCLTKNIYNDKIFDKKILPNGNYNGKCIINNNLLNADILQFSNNIPYAYFEGKNIKCLKYESKIILNDFILHNIYARINSTNFLKKEYLFETKNEKKNKNETLNFYTYLNPYITIQDDKIIKKYKIILSLGFKSANFLKYTKKDIDNKKLYTVKGLYPDKQKFINYIEDKFENDGFLIRMININDEKDKKNIKIFKDNDNSKFIVPKKKLFYKTNIEYITIEQNNVF